MFILGMLATATLDWQARRFVELNVLKRVIDNLAIPVDDSGDRANRVVHIATVLSVVDARFSSWAAKAGVPIEPSTPNQRADLMAELDAVVAHLYGLDRSDLEAIWDTFYDRVRRNDRRPDLVKVLEHHERWADTS
jgi:antitoxin component of RelBE/YafQ-DinJ toxin-antitoxin module